MNGDKFTIPSNNAELETDLMSNKRKYMDHIYATIFANYKPNQKDSLPDKMELFNFNQTSLQVIIKKQHYIITLENLIDYYINLEEYEKCDKLKRIINTLKDAIE
jgi:hypothetical protein